MNWRDFRIQRTLISILFCIAIYSQAYAKEKLIFAIDIVRHGDRTPIMPSTEMEKIWPQGIGQLTPKGMHQEYQLGKILRQRYVNQYHLLPQNYDVNTMIVRSSAMPRTLMSAQSLLYGLYPLGTGPSLHGTNKALPNGLQPIPINTVPMDEDSLLIPNRDKKKFREFLETHIINSTEWKQKENQLKSNYPTWSKIFNIPIHNLFDLIQVSDRLFIEQLYHLPLPNGLQKADADSIMTTGKWAWLFIANHPKSVSNAGEDLTHTIQQQMLLATKQHRPLKYLLFVAHDSTIAAQLRFLGQTLDDIPPYASVLNYSLFDKGAAEYEVRVTFNQKPLMINRCKGYSCTLSEFISVHDDTV